MENMIWPFFIEVLLKKVISYFSYSTFVGAVFCSSLVILRISLRTVSIANLTPLSRRAAHIGR